MRVVVEDVPARWDALLEGTRHDVFHTAGYQRFAAGSDKGDPYLIVVGDRERGLAWPYVLRRLDVVCGLADVDARDVGSFHGYTGPVIWGLTPEDPFVDRALDEARVVWREQGAVSAFTRFHPLLANGAIGSGPSGDGAGAIRRIGQTVSIDCATGADLEGAGYARSLRQEIARARRAGVRTEPDDEWQHLETFVRLYSDSMARKRAPAEYWVRESDVRRMRAELGPKLHLFVTHDHGRIVGAGIFSRHQGIVEALLVGTDESYRRWSPLKVMLHDVRRWAHERGQAILHLGGGRGGREDSLFQFKSRFSRRRHALHIGRWVLDQAAYDEISQVRARRLSEQRLTMSDAGWFPAYRSPVEAIDAAADDRRHVGPVAIPVVSEPVAIPVATERIGVPVASGPVAIPVASERIAIPIARGRIPGPSDGRRAIERHTNHDARTPDGSASAVAGGHHP